MIGEPAAQPGGGEAERLACVGRVREWNDAFLDATGRRRGVYARVFGCQQNEADAERLLGLSEAMGYERRERPEDADLILVNTCAVRERAERKALSEIGRYGRLRERNPNLIIGVCGCMASLPRRREELRQHYPYVTLTLGASSWHRLPCVLLRAIETGRRQITEETEEDVSGAVAEGVPVRRASSFRAWVSVMYGCDNFCSYCIVPYARGRERSRRREDIVREVRELAEAGYRDITLLGQNVNSYGRGGGGDFADLLEELDRIPGDYRLRFMTSHPKDTGRRLIDVMASSEHVARHLHLPLQSGSDRVLEDMGRRYRMEDYRGKVAYLRERIPGVVLTTDIMVGFPTETEGDFRETLAALEEIRFDGVFSFLYSPREGTPAAALPRVPDDVGRGRIRRLLETQDRISAERSAALLGRTVRALCDGASRRDPSMRSGRTEGNRVVLFRGTSDMTGRFVPVRVTETAPYVLRGEVVPGLTGKRDRYDAHDAAVP